MRRLVALGVAAAAALSSLVAPPAHAFTCYDIATIDLGFAYVDVRHLADDEALYSVWVWLESGVSPGLQRGGSQVAFQLTGQQEIATELGWTDADCPWSPASDYLIF